MLSQSARNVNTPIRLDSLFDGDARQVNRAERLAMTAAEMVRAAENRWNIQYGVFRVYQGGVGWVECATPYHDPSTHPWVHLLPVGWRTMPEGTFRTYLVRATAPHYGAPDWTESNNMHEWLTAGHEDTGSVMTETHP